MRFLYQKIENLNEKQEIVFSRPTLKKIQQLNQSFLDRVYAKLVIPRDEVDPTKFTVEDLLFKKRDLLIVDEIPKDSFSSEELEKLKKENVTSFKREFDNSNLLDVLNGRNREEINKTLSRLLKRTVRLPSGPVNWLHLYAEGGTGKTWFLFNLVKELSSKAEKKYFPVVVDLSVHKGADFERFIRLGEKEGWDAYAEELLEKAKLVSIKTGKKPIIVLEGIDVPLTYVNTEMSLTIDKRYFFDLLYEKIHRFNALGAKFISVGRKDDQQVMATLERHPAFVYGNLLPLNDFDMREVLLKYTQASLNFDTVTSVKFADDLMCNEDLLETLRTPINILLLFSLKTEKLDEPHNIKRTDLYEQFWKKFVERDVVLKSGEKISGKDRAEYLMSQAYFQIRRMTFGEIFENPSLEKKVKESLETDKIFHVVNGTFFHENLMVYVAFKKTESLFDLRSKAFEKKYFIDHFESNYSDLAFKILEELVGDYFLYKGQSLTARLIIEYINNIKDLDIKLKFLKYLLDFDNRAIYPLIDDYYFNNLSADISNQEYGLILTNDRFKNYLTDRWKSDRFRLKSCLTNFFNYYLGTHEKISLNINYLRYIRDHFLFGYVFESNSDSADGYSLYHCIEYIGIIDRFFTITEANNKHKMFLLSLDEIKQAVKQIDENLLNAVKKFGLEDDLLSFLKYAFERVISSRYPENALKTSVLSDTINSFIEYNQRDLGNVVKLLNTYTENKNVLNLNIKSYQTIFHIINDDYFELANRFILQTSVDWVDLGVNQYELYPYFYFIMSYFANKSKIEKPVLDVAIQLFCDLTVVVHETNYDDYDSSRDDEIFKRGMDSFCVQLSDGQLIDILKTLIEMSYGTRARFSAKVFVAYRNAVVNLLVDRHGLGFFFSNLLKWANKDLSIESIQFSLEYLYFVRRFEPDLNFFNKHLDDIKKSIPKEFEAIKNKKYFKSSQFKYNLARLFFAKTEVLKKFSYADTFESMLNYEKNILDSRIANMIFRQLIDLINQDYFDKKLSIWDYSVLIFYFSFINKLLLNHVIDIERDEMISLLQRIDSHFGSDFLSLYLGKTLLRSESSLTNHKLFEYLELIEQKALLNEDERFKHILYGDNGYYALDRDRSTVIEPAGRGRYMSKSFIPSFIQNPFFEIAQEFYQFFEKFSVELLCSFYKKARYSKNLIENILFHKMITQEISEESLKRILDLDSNIFKNLLSKYTFTDESYMRNIQVNYSRLFQLQPNLLNVYFDQHAKYGDVGSSIGHLKYFLNKTILNLFSQKILSGELRQKFDSFFVQDINRDLFSMYKSLIEDLLYNLFGSDVDHPTLKLFLEIYRDKIGVTDEILLLEGVVGQEYTNRVHFIAEQNTERIFKKVLTDFFNRGESIDFYQKISELIQGQYFESGHPFYIDGSLWRKDNLNLKICLFYKWFSINQNKEFNEAKLIQDLIVHYGFVRQNGFSEPRNSDVLKKLIENLKGDQDAYEFFQKLEREVTAQSEKAISDLIKDPSWKKLENAMARFDTYSESGKQQIAMYLSGIVSDIISELNFDHTATQKIVQFVLKNHMNNMVKSDEDAIKNIDLIKLGDPAINEALQKRAPVAFRFYQAFLNLDRQYAEKFKGHYEELDVETVANLIMRDLLKEIVLRNDETDTNQRRREFLKIKEEIKKMSHEIKDQRYRKMMDKFNGRLEILDYEALWMKPSKYRQKHYFDDKKSVLIENKDPTNGFAEVIEIFNPHDLQNEKNAHVRSSMMLELFDLFDSGAKEVIDESRQKEIFIPFTVDDLYGHFKTSDEMIMFRDQNAQGQFELKGMGAYRKLDKKLSVDGEVLPTFYISGVIAPEYGNQVFSAIVCRIAEQLKGKPFIITYFTQNQQVIDINKNVNPGSFKEYIRSDYHLRKLNLSNRFDQDGKKSNEEIISLLKEIKIRTEGDVLNDEDGIAHGMYFYGHKGTNNHKRIEGLGQFDAIFLMNRLSADDFSEEKYLIDQSGKGIDRFKSKFFSYLQTYQSLSKLP